MRKSFENSIQVAREETLAIVLVLQSQKYCNLPYTESIPYHDVEGDDLMMYRKKNPT